MSEALRFFEGRFGRVVLEESLSGREAHAHSAHQLIVKYDGADRHYLIDGERAVLDRDGILFVNAGRTHETLPNPGGASARLLVVNISPEWLTLTFPSMFRDAGHGPYPRTHDTITPHIRRIADAMVIDMMNDRFLSADRLEFMVQELILSIIDSYIAKRRSTSPMWRGSKFADARIRRAIALLRARPNKDVNMDDIATQVGLSRSRFYDLFQMCTGRSPREYLDMLCVETAITRLSTSDTKIADVSAELGFSAQSNFTRFFLNQVGASPSEYRRFSSVGSPSPVTPASEPAAPFDAGLLAPAK
ncbi:MAG: helix-turn-helix domain-containing protein [Proteobacteria bacterium]|nr:helix-turn-helix domain-containing protein [Pseudomonadota bacterium]